MILLFLLEIFLLNKVLKSFHITGIKEKWATDVWYIITPDKIGVQQEYFDDIVRIK